MKASELTELLHDAITRTLIERGLELVEVVYLRTRSGRVHRGVMLHGVLLTPEGDNIDQADQLQITPSEFEQAEPDALCRRCWRGGTA